MKKALMPEPSFSIHAAFQQRHFSATPGTKGSLKPGQLLTSVKLFPSQYPFLKMGSNVGTDYLKFQP
jgi:hypothetical protein